MAEWVRGTPSIASRFWQRVGEATTENGKIIETFASIRGKTEHPMLLLRRFQMQPGRYKVEDIQVPMIDLIAFLRSSGSLAHYWSPDDE